MEFLKKKKASHAFLLEAEAEVARAKKNEEFAPPEIIAAPAIDLEKLGSRARKSKTGSSTSGSQTNGVLRPAFDRKGDRAGLPKHISDAKNQDADLAIPALTSS